MLGRDRVARPEQPRIRQPGCAAARRGGGARAGLHAQRGRPGVAVPPLADGRRDPADPEAAHLRRLHRHFGRTGWRARTTRWLSPRPIIRRTGSCSRRASWWSAASTGSCWSAHPSPGALRAARDPGPALPHHLHVLARVPPSHGGLRQLRRHGPRRRPPPRAGPPRFRHAGRRPQGQRPGRAAGRRRRRGAGGPGHRPAGGAHRRGSLHHRGAGAAASRGFSTPGTPRRCSAPATCWPTGR